MFVFLLVTHLPYALFITMHGAALGMWTHAACVIAQALTCLKVTNSIDYSAQTCNPLITIQVFSALALRSGCVADTMNI